MFGKSKSGKGKSKRRGPARYVCTVRTGGKIVDVWAPGKRVR